MLTDIAGLTTEKCFLHRASLLLLMKRKLLLSLQQTG